MDKKLTVLYVCHDTINFGGAALSLDNMLSACKDKVNPIIWLPKECPVMEYFQKKGYECIASTFSVPIQPIEKRGNAYRRVRDCLGTLRWSYRCAKRMKQRLAGRDIDIIHSNSSAVIVGFTLAKMLHVRHVWHIREFIDEDFNCRPLIGWPLMRRFIMKSDAAISITKAVYDHWRLERHRNAYYRWDAVRSKRGAVLETAKEKYFLFCAAIVTNRYKCGDWAIEAFGKSGLAKDGYRLKLVGVVKDEECKAEFDSLAKKYGILDYIDYPGKTSDIRPYMKNASAFLMCSQFEGLGRVTVEAMFYGCPVIGRNTGGTAEIVSDGENGYLFDTIDECASLMRRVAEEDTMPMVRRAQQFAIENFSEEEYGEFVYKIYQGVLK